MITLLVMHLFLVSYFNDRAIHANLSSLLSHQKRITFIENNTINLEKLQEDVNNITFGLNNDDYCNTNVDCYVSFAVLLDKYAPIKYINVPNRDLNPVC